VIRATLLIALVACSSGPGNTKDDATDLTDPTDVTVTDTTDDTDPASDTTSTDVVTDSTDEDDPAPGGTVELGNGDQTGHVPLTDGADVIMVQGGQGGWHVWGSARVCGLGSMVRHTYRIYDGATGTYVGGLGQDQEDQRLNTVLVMEPGGDCGTIFGIFGYMMDPSPVAEGDADRPPEVYSGCALRLEMSFFSADLTKSATSSIEVVAQPDPINVGNYNLGRCLSAM
jgi:hypothetical protein